MLIHVCVFVCACVCVMFVCACVCVCDVCVCDVGVYVKFNPISKFISMYATCVTFYVTGHYSNWHCASYTNVHV